MNSKDDLFHKKSFFFRSFEKEKRNSLLKIQFSLSFTKIRSKPGYNVEFLLIEIFNDCLENEIIFG